MTQKKANKKAGNKTVKKTVSPQQKSGEKKCASGPPVRATYEVRMQCNNCHFHGNVSFQRGVPVSDGSQECPNCGCKTLIRGTDPFPGLRMPVVTPGRDRPVLFAGNNDKPRVTVTIPDDPHRPKRKPISIQTLSKEDTERWINLLRLADSE